MTGAATSAATAADVPITGKASGADTTVTTSTTAGACGTAGRRNRAARVGAPDSSLAAVGALSPASACCDQRARDIQGGSLEDDEPTTASSSATVLVR